MKWNKRCPECHALPDDIDFNNPQIEMAKDFQSAKVFVFCDHCGATIALNMVLDSVGVQKE